MNPITCSVCRDALQTREKITENRFTVWGDVTTVCIEFEMSQLKNCKILQISSFGVLRDQGQIPAFE